MAETLTSDTYVAPGVYIGELITPNPGVLTADARVCDYIGAGSTYATGSNLGIIRSFIYGEAINLPRSAPYQYFLNFNANGVQASPVQVYNTVTGVQLTSSQWEFVVDGNGNFSSIIIEPNALVVGAAFAIDYQSTSASVLDPLPVQGLRSIQAVGINQNRQQFKDFVNFYIPYSFTGGTGASDNSTVYSYITTPFPDAGNTGGGQIVLDDAASYDHHYNRFYQVTCLSSSGVSGSYVATFQWSSRVYSGGTNALPPTPLDASGVYPTFTVDQTNPQSLVQIMIELGIQLDAQFPSGNFNPGDNFYFNGVGPGLLEFNGTLTNTNQYAEFSPVTPSLSSGSTGSMDITASSAYTGIYNSSIALEVTAASGSIGARQVTFVWAQYGDLIGPTGTFTIVEASPAQLLTQGVTIEVDFGAVNFVQGDTFSFACIAPQTYYMAKDDRVIQMTISAATNPGADTGQVTGAYQTGTPEGGFGAWTVNQNLVFGQGAQIGLLELPDNTTMFVRNMMQGNVNGTSYVNGDAFTASETNEGVINWGLTQIATETRELSAITVDVTGGVTGTAGTYYIILSNIYIAGTLSVVYTDTVSEVSFLEISGTKFLAFVTQPTGSISVTYQYAGNQPVPGQTYYFTANYERPMSLYNSPQLILGLQDGRTLLAPAASTNMLYMMNELVFGNGAQGAYYTQPYNNDGSGNLSTTDVEAALDAHAGLKNATDLCLLSLFNSISGALEVNQVANDPFQARSQMLWVGAPIGTPIGDNNTPESLVYLAMNTLQVGPQSDAQGTIVLVAPTTCTVNLLLPNGITQTVTLDGSFVAGATSALVNSFADASTTILRKNLSGFITMQTYTEPENNILGQASITYLQDMGNSVFRFLEDITVSTLAEEFQLISATTQKQYVTRVVRANMDNSLISVVTPNAQAAVALIRSTLSGILLGLLGKGAIADYQDDNGNVRQFDSDTDIVIIRDSSDITSFNFYYAFWIKAPIKRLFGLFAVDTNDFGT